MQKRKQLSVEQAIEMMAEGEEVDGFQGQATERTWPRDYLIGLIQKCPCYLGGKNAQLMNHALVIDTFGLLLYVRCKEGTDFKAIEESL